MESKHLVNRLVVLLYILQGMTLDCVEITLSRVFECGQAYVALSRAKNLDGLRIIDFDRRCVRADAQVLEFYRQITRHLV